jgi:hypothetical protein
MMLNLIFGLGPVLVGILSACVMVYAGRPGRPG